jgi:hypothetical protein
VGYWVWLELLVRHCCYTAHMAWSTAESEPYAGQFSHETQGADKSCADESWCR